MRYFICYFLVILVSFNLCAQKSNMDSLQTSTEKISSSWSYEAFVYYYIFPEETNTVTLLGYVDHNALHLEARYNYEDEKTTSIFGGYNFEFGHKLKFEITPMVGFLVGNTKGVASGLEVDILWRKLDFYMESEYIFDFDGKEDDFYYSWIELGISPFRNFRTGISANNTRLFESEIDNQKGIFVEYAFGKFSMGVHYFNPFSNEYYLITTLAFKI